MTIERFIIIYSISYPFLRNFAKKKKTTLEIDWKNLFMLHMLLMINIRTIDSCKVTEINIFIRS